MITTQQHDMESLYACREPQPPAQVKGYWGSLPQYTALGALLHRLKQTGWSYKGPVIHLGKGGLDLDATVTVEVPKASLPPGTFHLVGLRNHHSRQEAVKLYYGLSLRQGCLILGEVVLCKHTLNVIPTYRARLDEALGFVRGKATTVMLTYERLREGTFKTGVVERVLVEATRRRLVPWSKLGYVDKAYRGTDGSPWGLLTAFCEVVTQNPPDRQMTQSLGCYKLVAGAF